MQSVCLHLHKGSASLSLTRARSAFLHADVCDIEVAQPWTMALVAAACFTA